MKRVICAATLIGIGLSAASPAAACLGPQFEGTVHVTKPDRPDASEVPDGYALFEVRFTGERSGREDRLWPNFLVVEILSGPGAGSEALIPAHITSCDSTSAQPRQGFVIGKLIADSNQGDDPRPVLGDRLTDKLVKDWPANLQTE